MFRCDWDDGSKAPSVGTRAESKAIIGYLKPLANELLDLMRCCAMSASGHQRSSAAAAGMSAPYAGAVVCEPKMDVAAPRSAIAGRADVDFLGGDFRS